MFPRTSLFDWSQMLAIFWETIGSGAWLVCRNILLLTASWTDLCFLVHDEKRIFQTHHTYRDGLALTAFSETWTKLNLSFHNQLPSDIPSQQWKSTKTITMLSHDARYSKTHAHKTGTANALDSEASLFVKIHFLLNYWSVLSSKHIGWLIGVTTFTWRYLRCSHKMPQELHSISPQTASLLDILRGLILTRYSGRPHLN